MKQLDKMAQSLIQLCKFTIGGISARKPDRLTLNRDTPLQHVFKRIWLLRQTKNQRVAQYRDIGCANEGRPGPAERLATPTRRAPGAPL